MKQITKFGFDAIQKRIYALQEKREAALAEAGAAAQDDPNSYHDNFSYEEGMRQADLFARQVYELQKLVGGAEVVALPTGTDSVTIGHVILYEQDSFPPEEILICGEAEGSVFRDACSAASPLGTGLLGTREGETRVIQLPARESTVKVLAIRVANATDFRPSHEVNDD